MKEVQGFEAIRWPEEMKPSRCPIHFTNELEVAASPEEVWAVLTDTSQWHKFYPGVQQVDLIGGGSRLRSGTKFETNLAGQDVAASVVEFEPHSRIAWYGGPKAALDAVAYHAWIISPTPRGCHLWTEETMRGPLWIELAKQAPDGYWLAHERLLRDLASVVLQMSDKCA